MVDILKNHLLPPWDGIKFDDKEDNTATLFTPSVVDKQGITSRDIVLLKTIGVIIISRKEYNICTRD